MIGVLKGILKLVHVIVRLGTDNELDTIKIRDLRENEGIKLEFTC